MLAKETFRRPNIDASHLFPDTKTRKDHAQQIFRIHFAGDLSEGVEGFSEVDGGEFGIGGVFGEELQRGVEAGVGEFQRGLVAGVDGDRVFTEVGFGEVEGGADFFGELGEALIFQAGDADGIGVFP